MTLGDRLKQNREILAEKEKQAILQKVAKEAADKNKFRNDFTNFMEEVWRLARSKIEKGSAEFPRYTIPMKYVDTLSAVGAKMMIDPVLFDIWATYLSKSNDEGLIMRIGYMHDGVGIKSWLTVEFDVNE